MLTSQTSTTALPTLRDHLLASLSILPNPFDLHLTIISSKAQRTSALFPHASKPPRCFERQYLVTLGVRLPPQASQAGAQNAEPPNGRSSNGDSSTQTATAGPVAHASTDASNGSSSSRIASVSAIHAYLYTLPKTHDTILYISKVDSSGYLPSLASRLPLTRALVSSFIGYHLLPSVRGRHGRCRVQLFARSQGQYLFANSSQNPAKRVGGGLGLCGWWKGVYEDVARRITPEPIAHANGTSTHTETDGTGVSAGPIAASDIGSTSTSSIAKVELRYLLPSYSADEAVGMLRPPRVPLPSDIAWTYGPPFAPLSSSAHGEPSASSSLAMIVPSFPDDPKTRFLEEIVDEGGNRETRIPPPAGGGRTLGPTSSGDTLIDDPSSGSKQSPKKSKVLAGSSSDVAKPTETESLRSKEKERDDAERRIAESALSKVSPEEFWERMGFRQECASGDVTGFFTLEVLPSSSKQHPIGESDIARTAQDGEHGVDAQSTSANTTPLSSFTDISNLLVDRLLTALLNCDFATLPLALDGTAIWLKSAKGIIEAEISQSGWNACCGTVKAKEGVEVAKAGEKRQVEVVTMLQPRKKKR